MRVKTLPMTRGWWFNSEAGHLRHQGAADRLAGLRAARACASAAPRSEDLPARVLRLMLTYALVNGIPIAAGRSCVMAAAMGTWGPSSRQPLRASSRASRSGHRSPRSSCSPIWASTGGTARFHAVPFLWRFHAIHHSIQELDWLAAHRVHPVDQTLTKAVIAAPDSAARLRGYGDRPLRPDRITLHGFLLHANVRIGFGPLKWVDRLAAVPPLASCERARRLRQELRRPAVRAGYAVRHLAPSGREASGALRRRRPRFPETTSRHLGASVPAADDDAGGTDA